ncbi:toxin VapC-like [Candidatus Termititenax aidoneus]|uniref:Toxin VapC-like n=1 Tax=Termititenax aidoneus TaxID=2218524 RepID=A0A388TC42_TERA1|nr:toxin VapC-like [Candidatus Termititenax aidoneus]
MNYLVDSCVWIDFFGQKKHFKAVSRLLFNNSAVVNEIILAELLPVAKLQKETAFIDCLSGLETAPLRIDWPEIAEIQHQCLQAGLNKVGLLDIVIAQNARQNGLVLFSTDKHMRFLAQKFGVRLKRS